MISITGREFEEGLSRYREVARQEPVAITNQGGESLVLLSAEEYRRLKQYDRLSLYAWELSEEDLRALAAAKAPDEAEQYNHELVAPSA